jgi:hypothetical protein
MTKLWTALLLASVIVLAACGNSKNESIYGNWSATLMTGQTATANLAFTAGFYPATSGGVDTNNFRITKGNGCFGPDTKANSSMSASETDLTMGLMSAATDDSGVVVGSSVISLQGSMADGSVSGTWTMTSPLAICNGGGNFTMTRIPGRQVTRP